MRRGSNRVLPYDKSLKQLSRNLTKTMTDAEMVLWSRLRAKQLKDRQFYRQNIIGNYIVDFYCPKSKLVVEVDGGQHYGAQGKQRDQERDTSLGKRGITVLRFSDRDVLTKLDTVLTRIWNEL